MAGEIISERRARSNRNGGRDHPGMAGDFPRNPHPKQAAVAGHFFKALAGDERSRRWCVDRAIGLQKASAEFPDGAGGFLVPEVVDAAIIRVLETVGAFRQGAEFRPTTSDAAIRPRRVGGLTATYVSDGQVIPESSFQLDA